MRRFGQVIRVKPEKLEYYRELHAHPWPSVLKTIKECHIQNYSIFLLNNETLFAYFEYNGSDFESDMKKMAADEETQRWWKETDPCQESISPDPDDWWMNIEEIFHTD